MSEDDKELALIFPPEASMSGRNSIYQFCDERQQQVSYAVCLHTLKKIESGTMPKDQFVECQRAYTHNNCPAKVMRQQEIDAGQALFFKERPRHITDPVTEEKANKSGGAVSSGKYDMSDPGYARGWAIGGRDGYRAEPQERKRNPKPPAPPVKKSGFVEETMADAITAMVQDDKKPKAVATPAPTPAAAPTTPSRPKAGESMADFIKRRALEGKKK